MQMLSREHAFLETQTSQESHTAHRTRLHILLRELGQVSPATIIRMGLEMGSEEEEVSITDHPD